MDLPVNLPLDLPLFPLPNVVLLPGMMVPLYIFEPRYREMVARVQQSGEPFGVVRLLPIEEATGQQRICKIGSLAHLVQMETHEDGTSSILITGGERFRILDIDDQTHSYISAQHVTLPMSPDPSEKTLEIHHLAQQLLERFLAQYPVDVQNMLRQDIPADPLLQSSFLAANMRLESDRLQHVLEANTTLERFKLLERWLPENTWIPPGGRTLN
jgi:uncharacterized protein